MRKCIWLTGLPGTGKTTIAEAVLHLRPEVQVLDGDVMRQEFWPQLGMVHGDRVKNVIRLAALAAMLMEHGAEVIVACVSPDLVPRECVRKKVEEVGKFYSVRLHCKAQRKKLHPNTVYEPGDHDLILDTGKHTPESAAMEVVSLLPRPKRALFIGRWQPFHAGHETIIREALAKGPVAIGVRQTNIDMDNPYSMKCRIECIQSILEHEDVVVFAVPDIASIHIGRDVGYEVHKDVRGISGSAERRKAREDMDPGGEG